MGSTVLEQRISVPVRIFRVALSSDTPVCRGTLHVTLQTPQPGDLVIRERQDASGTRPVTVFVISVWPDADESAGLHLTYTYALRQARAMAIERGVSVWRELASDQNRIEFDNVTED